MAGIDILSAEFRRLAADAGGRARRDALASGVTVFYTDDATGLDIMERPDGRRFEIRYIPGAPDDANYEVLRDLTTSAA
jgi:hypothetical protein